MPVLNNDWDSIIGEEFAKEYYLNLREFLKREYATYTIYPDMYDIFNAFKATPYDKVKVVILGQDPYHGPGQAHGMCFSVKPNVPAPPSLQNIFLEIKQELGGYIPDHGYLMEWASQGVMLLNTVLTVRSGQANSHRNMGWENFTDAVIKKLNEKKKNLVFFLWGNNARAKSALIDKSKHLILEAAHPSPLSAYAGFFGCGHFVKANQYLTANNLQPINWQITNKKDNIYIKCGDQ